MSEIEKLYVNAGISEKHCIANDCLDMSKCHDCYFNKVYHPPFTAEKQIELIKWLASSRKGVLISDMDKGDYNISTGYYYCAKHIQKFRNSKDLRVAIAMFINDLWQDLTEEERKQIKNILEG